MFTITAGKGFRITFPNNWTISVQWGRGNYCEKQDYGYLSSAYPDGWQSETAEVGIWSGEQLATKEMEIHGWQTPKEVADWMVNVASRPVTAKEMEKL